MCKSFNEGSDEWLFDFGGSRAISKLESFGTGLGKMTSVGVYRATVSSEPFEGK